MDPLIARPEKKFGELKPGEQFQDGRGHPYVKMHPLTNQNEQHYNAVDLKFGNTVEFIDHQRVSVSGE